MFYFAKTTNYVIMLFSPNKIIKKLGETKENYLSTNISKQKRDDLLNKIQQIKDYISAAPQDKNTANLLAYLGELTKEVNGKKYGLVFEEHREKIDEMLEENAPVLVEQEDLFIDNGGEMNFLIEGDNLAALKLLEKTYKGKIDVIYIDPPYNTGNKDFIYDDDYVDSDDEFRHSKWISFINKRLKQSRNLLSDKGVILISIDDNQKDSLKILCDEIFGENNNLGIFVIKSTPNARDYGYVGKMHEYMLFYSKNQEKVNTNLMPVIDKTFKYKDKLGGYNIHPLYNSNEAFTNINRPNLYYPFYLNPTNKDGDFFEISLDRKDNWIEIYPPKSVKNQIQFVWRWGREKSEKNLNKEIVGYCTADNEYRIVQKMRHDEKLIRSILDDTNYTSRKGTAELENIFTTKQFSFPKPIQLIRDVLFMSTTPSSTILDFFAGSGTTGHAVMKLNAEDGGNRKFILCTNNENNICQDVTYQRLKTVITGKRKDGSEYDENYKASLKYFKIDYLPIKDKMYYEYADELLEHVKELVELENAIDFNTNNSVAIVLDDEEFDDFVENIEDYPECKTLYMGHDVLTSYQQEQILKSHGISINVVPDYYYRDLAD